MSSPDETSPAQNRADGAQVPQGTGSATPSSTVGTDTAGDDTGGREVGVTAAVERGPAELSGEGEPVRPNPHASLDEGAGDVRSSDDL